MTMRKSDLVRQRDHALLVTTWARRRLAQTRISGRPLREGPSYFIDVQLRLHTAMARFVQNVWDAARQEQMTLPTASRIMNLVSRHLWNSLSLVQLAEEAALERHPIGLSGAIDRLMRLICPTARLLLVPQPALTYACDKGKAEGSIDGTLLTVMS